MKALCVKPMASPVVVDVEHNLSTLQSLVGGTVQAIYPWDDDVAILCDDEGKLKGYVFNRVLETESGEIYDIIAGNFLIVGLVEDSFGSLSAEQIVKYRKRFLEPEIFAKNSDGDLVLYRHGSKGRRIA